MAVNTRSRLNRSASAITCSLKPGEDVSGGRRLSSKARRSSDESTLTGEAQPVEKNRGTGVQRHVNLWGAVEVGGERRLPGESTLQKIIRLIQTRKNSRRPASGYGPVRRRYTFLVLGHDDRHVLNLVAGFHLPPFDNTPEHTSPSIAR